MTRTNRQTWFRYIDQVILTGRLFHEGGPMHIFFFLLLLFSCVDGFAVDLNYQGYYRSRGDYFKRLDLRTGQSRIFWDQRYRFDTDLMVNEYIHIKSQIDVLDNVVFGGNPHGLTTATNPSYFTTATDPNGNPYTTPSEDPKTRGTFFSQGEKSSILRVKRVWAELFANLGYFKIGRQPSHFGLGIYENSGDKPDDNFGDSVDRISFATRIDELSFETGFDKEVEIDPGFDVPSTTYGIDNTGEDVTRYFLTGGFSTKHYDVATFISRRIREGTDPDMVVWSYDLYGKYRYEWLTGETEIIAFEGDGGTDKFDIEAYNLVLKFSARIEKYLGILESGFSSGTKRTTIDKNTLHTIPFDKDYTISKLLFEEVLPGGTGIDPNNKDTVSYGTAPIAGGAISNAIYLRIFNQFMPIPHFQLYNNVLMAWAPYHPVVGLVGTTSKYASSTFYGFEYSFGFNHDINSFVHYGFDLAHFVPLGIFDDQRDLVYDKGKEAKSPYTLQTYLRLTF